jgi:hypothetical protein
MRRGLGRSGIVLKLRCQGGWALMMSHKERANESIAKLEEIAMVSVGEERVLALGIVVIASAILAVVDELKLIRKTGAG